jgi:asparagine synthase (glutamine-hydrolysing)
MCGLAGIFDTTGRREIDQALLMRMTDSLRHRGPDGEGFHVEAGLGLGHRRLAIIDIDGGQQPMYASDRSAAVVFNGEIYNYRALRTELQNAGCAFRTDSDTEVIVHAWQVWGADSVSRLDGMFAFALWDINQETLLLARDRLGKKPLYYCQLPDRQLVFGSEMKALMCHPGINRTDFEPTAIDDYFAYGYIPDPKTILRNVRRLMPAQLMVQRRNQPPSFHTYWDVTFQTASPTAAVEEELVERLRRAVRKRLVADVPLGASLSGGVDSSAVVAMMAGLVDEPVKSFSIGFANKSHDESEYAGLVARRYHTDHQVELVGPDAFASVRDLTRIFDEPFGDSSALPTYLLAELARRTVKVCLSGDGGDEAFAGYRRYLWQLREEQIRNLVPHSLRRTLFSGLARLYPKMDWAPRALRAQTTFKELALDGEAAYFNSVSVIPDGMRHSLLAPTFKADLQDYRAADVVTSHMRRADTDDPVQRAQYADLKTYLSGDILVKVDRASMAHSLEVRTPFLDHELLEWAVNLPTALKIKGATGKLVLKTALEPYLPKTLLCRPKMGFSAPLAAWFRGPLRDEILSLGRVSALHRSGIFDCATINRWADEHVSGRRDHSAPLWLALVFNEFLSSLDV